jgi:hypothetical protein
MLVAAPLIFYGLISYILVVAYEAPYQRYIDSISDYRSSKITKATLQLEFARLCAVIAWPISLIPYCLYIGFSKSFKFFSHTSWLLLSDETNDDSGLNNHEH